MAKDISEKTFELNITNELLNLSKSLIWYIDHPFLFHEIPKKSLKNFFNNSVLYAEGLTQKQEASEEGGYDVSINFNNPFLEEKRLLLLQFKSGIPRKYCRNNITSKFHQSKDPDPHIQFKFNDAANKSQHIILRNLATKPGIQSETVMYVFPRVTTKTDFESKIGNLIWNSSFVSVLSLDEQAKNQIPPLSIDEGNKHSYRTSYDGYNSEVNFFFYFYNYNTGIVENILSELICIQIERFIKSALKPDSLLVELFLENAQRGLKEFIKNELPQTENATHINKVVISYINKIKETSRYSREIPNAPSQYTTIIPKEGLKLKFQNKVDLSSLSYQVF